MTNFSTATFVNDPSRKGELTASKRIFGKNNRYAVAPVHSRFDKGNWFVWDAETPGDEYDPIIGYLPAIIRIVDSYAEAVAGLS